MQVAAPFLYNDKVDRIILEGIRFYGFHGTHPYEKKYGQEFVVDVEISADLSRSGKTDALPDTVDYVKAYEMVLDIGTNTKCNLLEALAERIAEKLLAFKKVKAVKVRVKKPKNLIGGMITSTGIEVERKNSGNRGQHAGSRKI